MEMTHIPAREKKKDTSRNRNNGEDSIYNDCKLERQLIKNFIKGLPKYIFLKLLSCTR